MDFGTAPEIMQKAKDDACLRHEGVKHPSRIRDMVTGRYLEYSEAQDNLGMSIFDPRNTILTCQEVKEKLYNKEICLVPTDNGIKVHVLNPELLRPDGPQRFVHPNRSNYNAAGQGQPQVHMRAGWAEPDACLREHVWAQAD
ncbi:g5356 [Coccomyxa viridis]|uniref:G5356 protein n=1 Tax=Coccomyxa viridis TaxID=1274662 RepID=A0ABP1FSM0_9CHLO